MEHVRDSLFSHGIASLRGAFTRDWVACMRQDIATAFADAIVRPAGALPRGPNRYYVTMHPGQLRGYADLASHPWVVGVCERVLGHDYQIVELGFEIPFPGAQNQPWHRDLPATGSERRLTSLVFHVTGIDTEHELAPGTQWESDHNFDEGRFPPRAEWPRYQAIAERLLPKMGDLSVRSALAIHRGTANRSKNARPVLVLRVDARGAAPGVRPQLVTHAEYATLPAQVRQHLACRVVERIEPIVHEHASERLQKPVP